MDTGGLPSSYGRLKSPLPRFSSTLHPEWICCVAAKKTKVMLNLFQHLSSWSIWVRSRINSRMTVSFSSIIYFEFCWVTGSKEPLIGSLIPSGGPRGSVWRFLSWLCSSPGLDPPVSSPCRAQPPCNLAERSIYPLRCFFSNRQRSHLN